MRFLILTLYIFFYLTSFSQIYTDIKLKNENYKNVYLDLNFTKIDSTLYSNKCKNKMRKCIQYSSDSTLIHAIYPTYQFGKLSEYSNKRIRKEIYRDKNYKESIIIHYASNLKPIDNFSNLKEERKIISRIKSISKRTNKCIKKIKNKFDVDVLHYYFKGDDKYTKDLHWVTTIRKS